jgi:glutamine amidotransferase
MIAIIDYGAGNLGSVTNAISKLGYSLKVTHKPEDVLNAKAVILPGVGAAGDAMARLKSTGMTSVIRQLINEKRPLFAICVGLQILLSNTEEGGGHRCLNIIPDDTNFYFVHSYYAAPNDKSVIAGITDYSVSICSMIIKDNLIATQFHPEKSGNYGLRMYFNFLDMALSGG